MTWAGKKVLVTGAGGFIGSHLTERLAREGADARAMVRYGSTGSAGWLDSSPLRDRLTILRGDIRDPDFVRKAMMDVDVVFHLAALIAIPYSYEAPISYAQVNIEGTLNVLQAARELGSVRVVHTSTSEVYGTARYVPIDEQHPLQGQSPYSATKIGADKLVEAYWCSYGTPVTTVRPFNTFGPRQSARAVIPTIIAQCLKGSTVRLGNLHPTRDLNFVTNTVDGFLLAASTPAAVGRTINLGSTREISIGDLAETIIKVVGRPVTLERDPARIRRDTSEVDRLLADSSLAKELLGWRPRVSLEEGLAATVEWMREHVDHYRSHEYVR